MEKSLMTADEVYRLLNKKIGSSGSGSGTSVTIDDTLTKSGQAADAKAAGDAIAEKMDKVITDSGTGLKYQLGLENGIMIFTEVK